MISVRYHIITIVAIFLAIGLGLLVGNTVVQPSLVNDLQRRTEQLRTDLADVRGEVGDLNSSVDQLKAAGDILAQVDSGGLADVPVVVVTQEGTDGALLSGTRQALDEAGARTVAVLSVTNKMGATDDLSRQGLAEIVGAAPDADPAGLQGSAADLLAERLANGPPAADGQSASPDVLDELLRANLLATLSPGITSGDVPKIGGRAQVVIVVAGGSGDPVLALDDFMVPLVEGLVQRGATVAAGESLSTDYPFVGPLRADGTIPGTDQMVTVDDLDVPIGGAALVLGLERLLTTGQGGNYGVKGDPPDVLPIPPET